ncbi:hypothetical protein C8R43DRAFT_957616 [Mycena crocata]|nr:hypothetical protein C8R43DRAFT_957616 [Mycena crocata]
MQQSDPNLLCVDPGSPLGKTGDSNLPYLQVDQNLCLSDRGLAPTSDLLHHEETSPTSCASSGKDKILIYQNLIQFFKDTVSSGIPGRDLGGLATTLMALDEYGSDNIISGIVESVACMKTLLDVSTKIRLTNGSRLCNALRTDEERKVRLLVSILDSTSAENSVLKLVLNKGTPKSEEYAWKARHIVRKLSESSEKLPSQLFITGVSNMPPLEEDTETYTGHHTMTALSR